MFQSITIRNLKAFVDTGRIPLAPITLIYGPNSVGKSTLIQALLLLKQSIESQDAYSSTIVPRGDYVDLGSFRSLIHRHELDRELSIDVEYVVPTRQDGFSVEVAKSGFDFQAISSAYSDGHERDSSALTRIRYEFVVQGENFKCDMRLKEPKRSSSPIRDVSADFFDRAYEWGSEGSVEEWSRFIFQFASSRHTKRDGFSRKAVRRLVSNSDAVVSGLLPRWARSSAKRSEVLEETVQIPISHVLEEIASKIERNFFFTTYLGPMRSHPARYFFATGGSRVTVGVRGEHMPQVVNRRRDTLTEYLNHRFRQFEIPYSVRISRLTDDVTGELLSMALFDHRAGVVVAPSDVGFGIGQLMPIIVEGMVCREGVICVEQPEIHLHPRLQGHVADLLIDTARQNRNQWIVETHSEAIMLRLQRRIREGLNPNFVKVIYVQEANVGSTIKELRLDKNGEFVDEWPDGFFEESYRELF